MKILHILFLFLSTSIIISAVKSIINKKNKELLIHIFLFLFVVFFYVTALLGGSAFHDAQADYEFYETGHYYLMSHGNYTEVTYGQYLFALIAEIVGLTSIGVVILWNLLDRFLIKEPSQKDPVQDP